MDSGAGYFGRFEHQAVITRAGRPDIQMASLMQATSCLILTGGTEPTDYIKAEALQRDIPMILVQGNTLATAEALSGLLQRSYPPSRQKIERFTALMQQELDLAALDLLLDA
jgi:BioD-like phosphotransacetylase family protein